MRIVLFCLTLLLAASPSVAQETLGLAAPPEVTDSGLLRHILPRFSLKTGLRVAADPAGAMEIAEEPPGIPVFRRGQTTYYLRTGNDPGQERFRDWLVSDIGKRTVESFQPEAQPPFSADIDAQAAVTAREFPGDARLGAGLAMEHCGRCHVIGRENRMGGLGSTPSFPVLRALPDWDERFQTFFVRNPHPAFTQVEGLTAAFDPGRPPPIFPVAISQTQLDAILAFVAAIEAADLGAPLQLQ